MTCPICRRAAVAEYRPFCSKRCADIDLAKWMTGAYAVPSEDPDDIDEAIEAADRAATEAKPH